MSLTGKPPQVVYGSPPKEPAVDLFTWIAALYTKAVYRGTPPTYMMHRFMASDRSLAQACRILQNEVREPGLVFRCWQALLPKTTYVPRFAFAAPKRQPDEELLVTRMKAVLSESRSTVETTLEIIKLAGREADLYREFGMLAPGERALAKKKSAASKATKTENTPPPQGLLARLKR